MANAPDAESPAAAHGARHVPDHATDNTPGQLRKSRRALERAQARQLLVATDDVEPPANGIVRADGANNRKI